MAGGLWLALKDVADGLWLALKAVADSLWLALKAVADGLWLALKAVADSLWLALKAVAAGSWLAWLQTLPDWLVAGFEGCDRLLFCWICGLHWHFVMYLKGLLYHGCPGAMVSTVLLLFFFRFGSSL